MPTDFDQSQDELAQYLEQMYGGEQETPNNDPTPPQEPSSDDVVNDYLKDEDGVEETPQEQPQYTPIQQTQKPQGGIDERTLALERELAATKARSEMYERAIQAQYQQPQQQGPAPLYDADELQVDERYETDYGDASPYIQSIAKRVAADMYQRTVLPLQQQLAEVNQRLAYQQQSQHTQQLSVFETQLKAVVPDLEQIANSAEWQSYIRQGDVYGGTRTIAQYVQDGIQSGNVRQVAAIIDQFKRSRSKGQPQQQHVAPGRSQTTVPQTKTVGRGKMLSMSSFDRATQDFQNGKISYDIYQKIMDQFNTAAVEGRVNYNK